MEVRDGPPDPKPIDDAVATMEARGGTRGLKRKIECAPALRGIAYAALCPWPSRIGLLGFSRDGEWVLGAEPSTPWLLAWRANLTSAAAPLRVADATRVLPLPLLVADDEGIIEPRRLVYAETPSAAVCFASTFTDDDGSTDWKITVARRPSGVSRANSVTMNFSTCRGAESPGAACVRSVAGGVLAVLNCGDALKFLRFRAERSPSPKLSPLPPLRPGTKPPLARIEADGRWWRTSILPFHGSKVQLVASTSLLVEALLAAATPRLRKPPRPGQSFALVDYAVAIPRRRRVNSDVITIAIAWRSRPVAQATRLAVPSSDDIVTAALLDVDTETGRVDVFRLVDVANVDARLSQAARALDDADAGAPLGDAAAVRAAGGWKQYVREPVVKLHALRYLTLAGRATPPQRLAGLFGSSALPDVIFDKILGFWKEPEPVWVLELGGRPVATFEHPKYPVVIDATAPPD